MHPCLSREQLSLYPLYMLNDMHHVSYSASSTNKRPSELNGHVTMTNNGVLKAFRPSGSSSNLLPSYAQLILSQLLLSTAHAPHNQPSQLRGGYHDPGIVFLPLSPSRSELSDGMLMDKGGKEEPASQANLETTI